MPETARYRRGGAEATRDVLWAVIDFAQHQNVKVMIEKFPLAEAQEALEHMMSGDFGSQDCLGLGNQISLDLLSHIVDGWRRGWWLRQCLRRTSRHNLDFVLSIEPDSLYSFNL